MGQRCFIRWPFLQEAIITAVSDADSTFAGGSASTTQMLGQKGAAKGVAHKKHSAQVSSQARRRPARTHDRVQHAQVLGRLKLTSRQAPLKE